MVRTLLTVICFLLSVGVAEAQFVNSKTLDGIGNPITSTITGPKRGLDVNCLAGCAAGGGGGTSSTFGAAFPATGTAAGFSDGTPNMRPGFAVDADTGAGSTYVQGVNLVFRGVGGPVEAGIAANPFNVTGTVAATQSGVWNIGTLSSITNPVAVTGTFFQATQPISAVALPLPTGAATEATLGTLLLDSTFTGRFPAGANPADAESNAVNMSHIAIYPYVYNNVTWSRVRQALNGMNNSGVGLPVTSLSAQFDDVSPVSIAENSFGQMRMSTNRNLYGTIRDAAGNERGANVTAGNALLVDASATTQPVSGTVAVSNSFLLDATFTGRFPAAYVDADTIANQTTTAMHGQLYGYNGTTWDRLRSTIANGLAVDVTRVTGNVTVVQGTGTNLHVVCDSGCTPGGSFADNAAFTFGTTAINNMGAVVDDVATNTVTENSAGAPRMNTNRVLYGLPTNASGVALYPTAVVEADALANPTLTQIGVYMHGYNGTTWDRLRSTTANGLAVDVTRVQGSVAVTGTFFQATQPVSGTVAVSNAFLLDATFTARINTLGQKTMANSTPVVLASDQTSIPITVASLPLPAGAATEATLATRLADATFTGRFVAAYADADTIANQTTTAVHGQAYFYNGTTWDRMRGTIAGGLLVNVSNATLAVTQSGTWNIGTVTAVTSITNPVAVTNAGLTNLDVTLSSRFGTLGQKTMAGSAPVVIASDQAAIPVTVLSTVASANNDGACPSGAASFTALASNASRTWAAIWASPANTDDVYIKLGATATSSDARFSPGQPLNFTTGRIYTGIVDAFPASGTQAVCVMELN